MACLCPISIPDKALRMFGVRNASIVVPCGHCIGCAHDRRNDWFVRLWSVYQEHRKDHLPVWFVTVTIDPRLWPHMTLDSPGIEDRVTPFMRSWNERLRYLNGGKMPLRFLCSEFGSKGRDYIDFNGVPRVSTGALHFHGLLFGKLNVSFIQRGLALTHGHVDFELIRGPQAIRYCVKYCTKDYSVENPRLRSRTFCSPGLGDPSYYFGSSSPTSIVIINGYHYRCPRYLIEKQWISVYGKNAFYNSIGSNILVDLRARCRLDKMIDQMVEVASYKYLDPEFVAYKRYCLVRDAKYPSDVSMVLSLIDTGKTGYSHPLIRYYFRRISQLNYEASVSQDNSFMRYTNSLNEFNNFIYERSQTFLPISFDIPS